LELLKKWSESSFKAKLLITPVTLIGYLIWIWVKPSCIIYFINTHTWLNLLRIQWPFHILKCVSNPEARSTNTRKVNILQAERCTTYIDYRLIRDLANVYFECLLKPSSCITFCIDYWLICLVLKTTNQFVRVRNGEDKLVNILSIECYVIRCTVIRAPVTVCSAKEKE